MERRIGWAVPCPALVEAGGSLLAPASHSRQTPKRTNGTWGAMFGRVWRWTENGLPEKRPLCARKDNVGNQDACWATRKRLSRIHLCVRVSKLGFLSKWLPLFVPKSGPGSIPAKESSQFTRLTSGQHPNIKFDAANLTSGSKITPFTRRSIMPAQGTLLGDIEQALTRLPNSGPYWGGGG